MHSRRLIVTVALLAVTAALAAPSFANAQSAAGEFNKIIGEMGARYYSCADGLKGEARKQAYIDHGKLEASRWEAFLAKYADSSQAFYARCYLAKALNMAKESEKAKEVVQAARKEITDLRQVKALAEAAQVVHLDNEVAVQVIEEGLGKLDYDEDKAELHMELLRYPVTPKNLKKSEQKTFREKQHAEIVAAVATAYPDTRAGREAARMVQGLRMKVGDPMVDLKDYRDGDGKDLDLAAYQGKVVLVLFWTGGSRSERFLKQMVELHRELNPKGLEIVGVNCDYAEDKERNMEDAIRQLDIPWRNYHDGEKLRNKIALTFYVRKFPFGILVDRGGKVAALGLEYTEIPDAVRAQVGK